MDIYVKKKTSEGEVMVEINQAVDEYVNFCMECERNATIDYYQRFEAWLENQGN